MGSGRACHPLSPIFTPSLEVLKTFSPSEFGYYSFSGLGDMHIKLIRAGTTPAFRKKFYLKDLSSSEKTVLHCRLLLCSNFHTKSEIMEKL